ncbi:hypothetical protein [Novosphingobium sp.]|uniref:hypothetical protein n=1 Tax=Novosphingobium sp. TaxID=1874826 RepID=UPI00333FF165
MATPAAAGQRQDASPGYARAIDCAAGEAVLAGLLGAANPDPADRATIDRLDLLAQGWLRVALAQADSVADARTDLAQARAALIADLATVHDPDRLTALLDARLRPCALRTEEAAPGAVDAPGTIG